MQTNLPWILSEWHVYSASSAPIKMDGVLFQDIYSIIDTMMKKKEVQVWTARVKTLYEHLADYNNPHHVTVDQMPTKVIDILYNAWRNEGYKGDLEFFTRLLFTYLEIVQFAEMMGVDEDGNPNIDKETLIPSVLAVAEYIKMHDNDLHAHDPLMAIVFSGDLIRACPTSSFYQFLGVPMDLVWDEKASLYKNIDAFGDTYEIPQEFTIVGGARFNEVNQFIFGVHSADALEPLYYVNFDWPNRAIQLKMRHPLPGFELWDGEEGKDPDPTPPDPDPVDPEPTDPDKDDEDDGPDLEGYYAGKYDETMCWIDVGPYLADWDGSDDVIIPVALIIQRHHIRLAVWKELSQYDITGIFSVIADMEIPTKRRSLKNPRVAIARMDRDDPLYSVVTYREAMTDEQLLFLMDQHSLPINRTV